MMRTAVASAGFLLVCAAWVSVTDPVALRGYEPGGAVADKNTRHPLIPALELARRGLSHIQQDVRDYQAILIKRERIGDQLADYEFMQVKVRHEQRHGDEVLVPFSVYLKFLAPSIKKGREVIYVRGRNNDMLMAHEPPDSLKGKLFKTVSLPPNGLLAMQGNRYPITEIGIQNLTRRLIQVAEEDLRYDECQVAINKNARVNDRRCTRIQVVHPIPRQHFRFHVAEIFVDDELQVPIRYAAFDWPVEGDDQPVLLEEYTYRDLQLNVGLTDKDFDPENPDYDFQ